MILFLIKFSKRLKSKARATVITGIRTDLLVKIEGLGVTGHGCWKELRLGLKDSAFEGKAKKFIATILNYYILKFPSKVKV